MSKHLYNSKDVADVRLKLYGKQQAVDWLTGLPLDYKDAVLDHNHRTQFVRGVLHRQVNAALGKIENIWDRYLKSFYPGTLSDFLRDASVYIEEPDNHDYVHPHWLKKCKTEFNKLNSSQKSYVLYEMTVVAVSKGYTPKSNSSSKLRLNDTIRKKQFASLLMSRKLSYKEVLRIIEDSKDETNHIR